MSSRTTSSRRKLFAPTPIPAANGDNHPHTNGTNGVAAATSASEARRSYSLRTRSVASASVASTSAPVKLTSRTNRSTQKRANPTRVASPSTASEESDFSADVEGDASDADSDLFTAETSSKSKAKGKSALLKPTRKIPAKQEQDNKSTSKKRKSASSSPKKPPASPFDISPRKPATKPIKVNLDPSEAHPAPPHWETVYSLLSRQRTKIVAPVDTMGCDQNGRSDRRADSWRDTDTPQDAAKRERLATLVSLMLSSQTKDPVTAEAVYNLQRTLPDGLCLKSLLEADDETISSCIAKVGFWRRKTGYLKSAARILKDDFQGDLPRTVDELCSLPGVGPKMAFLALSSMGIQIGIGVDTHVHRLTNRLGWHKTTTPEQTRLNLQSWLPQELHAKINSLLVGFGQVICVPLGPRCDLCDVGKAGFCPSRRVVDEKSTAKRVKVELLRSDDERMVVEKEAEPKVKVEVEMDGPEGRGTIEVGDLLEAGEGVAMVKKEEGEDEQAAVERALDW
ncbi:related to NTG1-DNA repair protein [Ustilago bromivora]|uniref:Endonuclease III homolog n=1 Tax=Ustilago bromivora TaxID=307758 RepID=A0A1K0G8C6_9BASI|nr:related to NTG1-DNA repair protein [Ustilago bromivora]SYW80367.1 related to NTG1 - DNA repair protein [Ustilago bromivora]